jgi:acid phosphatase family membrane protein YuiD
MKILPMALIIACAVQVSCQVFKFVIYSIRDKKVKFHYLATAGGMPSAHSAFVTATTTAIALISGLHSELFTVCAVFAFIVIYDSYRLRGTVQRQSIILNKMMKDQNFTGEKPLNEMIGHSIPEIVAGIMTGLLFSALYTKLFSILGLVKPFYEWIS